MSRMTVPTNPNRSQSSYTPVPPDNHVGVCIGITDLGTHMKSYQGQPARPTREIRLQFELPDVTRPDGTTATISKSFNYSLNEKSTFRKTLDAWLGSGWTEKYRGQSWEFLLGIPGMVLVEQAEGKDYTVVQSVTKLPARMQAPEATRDTFFLDLDNKHLPANLSSRDAEHIRESHEYKAGGFTDEAHRPGDPYPGQPQPQAQPAGPAMGKAAVPADDDMSDVPFADPDPVRFLPPSLAREERMRRFESTDIC